MDQNFIGAPAPETAENHPSSELLSDNNNTFDLDESLQNLLHLEPSDFDFDIFDLTLPLPSPPPATYEMSVSSILAPSKPHISPSLSAESDSGGSSTALPVKTKKKKKNFSPDQLEELARNDPKKLKRILDNRKAAARSKERKKRYQDELEKNVKALQIHEDNVTAEFLKEKENVLNLAAENRDMKECIQIEIQKGEMIKAQIEMLMEELRMVKIQMEQLDADPIDSSFDEMLSQSELQAPYEPELLCVPPSPPPLSPLFDHHFEDQFFNHHFDEHFFDTTDFFYYNPLN